MDRSSTRMRDLLVAGALFCLVVSPIAAATAASDAGGPQATRSASVKKKLKKLKKRVKALEKEQGEPRPPTGSAGGALSGEYPNPGIRTGALGTSTFARSIPAAGVFHSNDVTVQTNTATTVPFNSERYDTAGMHGNAPNSRIRAPVTGIYSITANVRWEVSATGEREMYLVKNGTTRIAFDGRDATGSTSGTGQSVIAQPRLQAGDFVTVQVFQNSGSPATINHTSDYSPEFSMVWQAPGP